MAISATHVRLMREIKALLPVGGDVLQIGEANWYGDLIPDFPHNEGANLWELAKAFYADLFSPQTITSIDMGGSDEALRYDLNYPLPFAYDFDLVINHGTAEHIFNIARVFETMHELCKPGGLMIHEAPFTGWVDHGFYCLQPTLFYDLAEANDYKIEMMAVASLKESRISVLSRREAVQKLIEHKLLPGDALLFVVYRRTSDDEFYVPTQGYYAGALSESGNLAWIRSLTQIPVVNKEN